MSEQAFEDYKSKYLDLYDKVRTARSTEKESVLEEVDFELELIQRDEINVAYILRLLAKLKEADTDKEYEYQYKAIMQLIGSTPELRSKQELIERFIKEHMADLGTSEEVLEAFDSYWENEKGKATQQICEEEGLIPDHIQRLVEQMIYSNEEPLRQDVIDTMKEKPGLLKREDAYTRITQRVKKLVEVFYRDI
jgi:type I restriction enzyme R subunit